MPEENMADVQGATENPDKPNDDICESDSQDESTSECSCQTDDTENIDHNDPRVERSISVRGEINALVPRILDISEVCFGIAQNYEIHSLSKYFMHEWSEAEHLFKSAMDFAEEMYSDWSPCPSPSPTSMGL